MRHKWLVPLAIGVFIGSVIPLMVSSLNRSKPPVQNVAGSDNTDVKIIWSYKRNTGPNPWPTHTTIDPADSSVSLSEYAISAAEKCRVSRWNIESTETVTDIDQEAQLLIPESSLSNKSFNCLASLVRPPYVTLSRRDKNDAPSH